MKKSSYFVKSLIGLSLIGSVALANDIELDDEKKDLEIKSSIQVNDDISENEEKSYAKIDVNEVINILRKEESGKIINVELENEDGNLVYKAEVIKDNQSIDFIVDAGNGKILHKEVDKKDKSDKEDEHEDNDENEKEKKD
ncbi:hypothetical protein LPB137_07765 [Poseidonibacter parvus]|uniref:PepSY domain-containing protein n=1 Tax=Poseidonibacter parvus TaxID=1850254 RepID=A0A1P8KMG5_9BACT|nr:PepSY domain-containing protein [Poseidonibacter parvus]APW65757.1 hypothetical protein LPB137_07765 [Poseidonibacter parvus]